MLALKIRVKVILVVILWVLTIHPQKRNIAYENNQLGNGLISLAGVFTLSQTDYSNGKIGLGAIGQAEYFLSKNSPVNFGIRFLFGGQTLRGEDPTKVQTEFMTDMYILGGGLTLGYTFDYRFYPYIYAGASNLWFSPKDKNGKRLQNNQRNAYTRSTTSFDLEVGSRVVLQDNLSMFLGIGAHFTQSDNLDDIAFGDGNDSYYSGRIGISLALFSRKDTDKDGFMDSEDPCPSNPEDYDGFKDDDGCPDYDNDGDKIPDEKDKCPNAPEDFDGFQDDDGCPDLDNDGDGILDKDDKCPNEPENFNGYEDKDGCPDILSNLQKLTDRDADGISDELDKCPDQQETFNGFQDDDGCPDSLTTSDTLTTKEMILDGMNLFEWRGIEIKPTAYEQLDRLAEFLAIDPFIKWAVESYTDNNGNADSLKVLSQERAIAVVRYLIDKSLPSFMFKIYAKGSESPVADNNNLEGRLKNNRIVIKKLD